MVAKLSSRAYSCSPYIYIHVFFGVKQRSPRSLVLKSGSKQYRDFFCTQSDSLGLLSFEEMFGMDSHDHTRLRFQYEVR